MEPTEIFVQVLKNCRVIVPDAGFAEVRETTIGSLRLDQPPLPHDPDFWKRTISSMTRRALIDDGWAVAFVEIKPLADGKMKVRDAADFVNRYSVRP